MLRFGLALLAWFTWMQVAWAGSVSSVKVEPPSAPVGTQIKVTVEGEDEGICGLRVEYGNGDVDVTKMNAGRDNFPRSFMKSWNAPGTYTITAKGGRDGSTFGCSGEAKTVVRIDPRPAAPEPAPAPAPAPVVQAAPLPAVAPPAAAPGVISRPVPLKDDPKGRGRSARGG